MEKEIEEILEMLDTLQEERGVPKNVKSTLQSTKDLLEETTDMKIKVNKALHKLDEISDDPNIETFTRTQIWNVVSLLEKLSYCFILSSFVVLEICGIWIISPFDLIWVSIKLMAITFPLILPNSILSPTLIKSFR